MLGFGRSVAASDENDSDLVKQIKELIETRVRPAVAQDGGDIIFRGFHDGIVQSGAAWLLLGLPELDGDA